MSEEGYKMRRELADLRTKVEQLERLNSQHEAGAARAEHELSELQAKVAALEADKAQGVDTRALMAKAIGELEADKERLDWLEDSGYFDWAMGQPIRQAIDAARKKP